MVDTSSGTSKDVLLFSEDFGKRCLNLLESVALAFGKRCLRPFGKRCLGLVESVASGLLESVAPGVVAEFRRSDDVL
jgi:hypothetical protein